MKIPIKVFFLLIIVSCNQNKESKSIPNQKEEILEVTIEEDQINAASKNYQESQEDAFNWDLVFKKAATYRTVSKAFTAKDSMPKGFKAFGQKFITDAEFQKQHIDFENLIAVIGACEENLILGKSNWKYDYWDFIENLEIDPQWENTFHYSENVFFIEYVLKEVGTIRMLGFEKKDGSWYLTLYDVNDC